MATVRWLTVSVDKSLGMQVRRDSAGEAITYVNKQGQTKSRMESKGTVPVPYTHPKIVLNSQEDDPIDAIAICLLDILKAAKPGFDKAEALVESINNGLYVTNRNAVARGADVRYTMAQRTLVRNLGNLVRDGLFERDMAVQALKMQGISDPEDAIDAYVSGESEEEEDEVS